MTPAFDRATRLAKSLFRCLDSLIVLIGDDGVAWRSRDPGGLPVRDTAAERIIASGQPLWIEDPASDPDYASNDAVISGPGLRFYAGAPIIEPGGRVLGAVCVVDIEPHPLDQRLLARLMDIANGLADDFERLTLIRQAGEAAQAVQSANDTLTSLVRHIPMGVVMTDRDLVIMRASPLWAGFYGRTETDVVGEHLYDIATPFAKNHELHMRVLNGKREVQPRFGMPLANGSTLWLKVELIPWRRTDGEVGGMMVTTTNITEMVEALERTQRSEQRLQMAVDLADLHVWEMDYKRRALEKVGDASSFFDVPLTYEQLEADIMCAVHPGDRVAVRAHLDRVGVDRHEPILCRMNRSDGKEVWAANASQVIRDADGNVERVVGLLHNLTSMKMAEKSLIEALDRTARSEQRLQMAVRLADLHVWEVDFKRQVLEKVGNAETFFDQPLTYEDVAGDILCGIHPDDRELAGASLQSRIEHGHHDPLIARTRRTDGKDVWAASAAEVIMGDDGKPERIVGMFHNLTRMKLAEKSLIEARDAAEAANRSKSEFLANMSHEIRTPLNGVLGMAQVIEGDELSEVQRGRIKVVRESGSALLAILNDVLDLSKIQAGKLELEVADFDIEDLAPVVVAAFEGVAAAKDVALSVEIDASAAGAWKGDILRLRQVASNLVSNALKFTQEGEVALTVRHDGQALVLAVRDSGIGIDPDKIPMLFEKFSQEDASTTRRYGGTGLGLSICRELVELMGGHIEVASEKGRGSVFSVVVPLQRGLAAARPAKAVRNAPAPDQNGAAALTILAAEDNPTNQLVLRSLLAPLGVDLTLVGNGREAVEAFRAGRFDIVLMDVQMPEMNGVEATQAIRAWEQEHGRRRTPILSLTANVMTHQIEEYRAVGMDGAIAKPIEVEKLYAALDEALTAAELAAEDDVAAA